MSGQLSLPEAVPGKQGAARQSWQESSPRAVLQHIISTARDPHDRKTIKKKFFEIIIDGSFDIPPRVGVMMEYWFDNHYMYFLRVFPKSEQPQVDRRAELQASKEATRHAVAERVTKVRAAIHQRALMLATMMPIGKAFGDCTGHELRAMRASLPKALTMVLRKVGDNQMVREVLTDAELKKMNLRLV